MTLLDFKTGNNFLPPDPSNLDFRIWLAWHDEPDRIYAAFVIADDEYRNEHDYNSNSQCWMFDHDSVVLQLDADHSGGSGRERAGGMILTVRGLSCFLEKRRDIRLWLEQQPVRFWKTKSERIREDGNFGSSVEFVGELGFG